MNADTTQPVPSSDLTRYLAREITGEVRQTRNPELRLRQATVVSVTANASGQQALVPLAQVTLPGTTTLITAVALEGYDPDPGDVVWLLQNGPDLLIIGRVANGPTDLRTWDSVIANTGSSSLGWFTIGTAKLDSASFRGLAGRIVVTEPKSNYFGVAPYDRFIYEWAITGAGGAGTAVIVGPYSANRFRIIKTAADTFVFQVQNLVTNQTSYAELTLYTGRGASPGWISDWRDSAVYDNAISGTAYTAGLNDYSFAANFAHYDAGYSEAAHDSYWRDTEGVVHLQGLIKATAAIAANANPNLLTLPSGYRPVFNQIFSTRVAGGNGTEIRVLTTGVVQLFNTLAMASGDWLSLDGVTFRTF